MGRGSTESEIRTLTTGIDIQYTNMLNFVFFSWLQNNRIICYIIWIVILLFMHYIDIIIKKRKRYISDGKIILSWPYHRGRRSSLRRFKTCNGSGILCSAAFYRYHPNVCARLNNKNCYSLFIAYTMNDVNIFQ